MSYVFSEILKNFTLFEAYSVAVNNRFNIMTQLKLVQAVEITNLKTSTGSLLREKAKCQKF